MEPSIYAYNPLIINDSAVEQVLIDTTSPGAIFLPDYNKYYELIQLLFSKQLNSKDVYVAKSHNEIITAIHNWNIDNNIIIYNIDHHHDCGYPGTNEKKHYAHCTCGNWVTYLAKTNPAFIKYIWIHNKNSFMKIDNAAKEFLPPMNQSTDITTLTNIYFDKIFICLSPGWIPTSIKPLGEALVYSFEKYTNK